MTIKREMRQDKRTAPKTPINENISAREVRLIGADGEQIGHQLGGDGFPASCFTVRPGIAVIRKAF